MSVVEVARDETEVTGRGFSVRTVYARPRPRERATRAAAPDERIHGTRVGCSSTYTPSPSRRYHPFSPCHDTPHARTGGWVARAPRGLARGGRDRRGVAVGADHGPRTLHTTTYRLCGLKAFHYNFSGRAAAAAYRACVLRWYSRSRQAISLTRVPLHNVLTRCRSHALTSHVRTSCPKLISSAQRILREQVTSRTLHPLGSHATDAASRQI